MNSRSTLWPGITVDRSAIVQQAPAQKVSATAVEAPRRATAQGGRVTRVDNAELPAQRTNGPHIDGMTIGSLGDRLSHMPMMLPLAGPEPNAAATASDSTLRFFSEMKVERSRARQWHADGLGHGYAVIARCMI